MFVSVPCTLASFEVAIEPDSIAFVTVPAPIFSTAEPAAGLVTCPPVNWGILPAPSVPLEIFEAFVASVVADAAKLPPFVLVTVSAPVPVFSVASPPIVSPLSAPPLLYCTCPEAPPGVAVAVIAWHAYVCVLVEYASACVASPQFGTPAQPPVAAAVVTNVWSAAALTGTDVPLIFPAVSVKLPAGLVTSPLCAGSCAAASTAPVVISVADAGIAVPFTLVLFDSAAGSRAAPSVPLEIFEAFVASVVADAASPLMSAAPGCPYETTPAPEIPVANWWLPAADDCHVYPRQV
jgi:hypothetical protein